MIAADTHKDFERGARHSDNPWLFLSAGGLAGSIGNVKDAGVIRAVAIFNAFVGFYQEHRAEQPLAALREILPTRFMCVATGTRSRSTRNLGLRRPAKGRAPYMYNSTALLNGFD